MASVARLDNLAVLVLTPVLLMLVYSFLTKEFSRWRSSGNLALPPTSNSSAIADSSEMIHAVWNGHNINIFWRSIWQAGLATLLCLCIGFPTAYFIATRPERVRPMWVFLITIPYWVNLLIRTVSMRFMLREEGPVNNF